MMVMFHDDDCGELLDGDGECPRCHFHPDMQSTAFKEVADELLRDGIERLGRTYLGKHRERVNRAAQVTPKEAATPEPVASPALSLVPPLPTDLEAIEALEQEIYLEFRKQLKVVHDALTEKYTNDFVQSSTLISVLHAAHAEQVGRYEKILEEALQRVGIPVPDLVKVRRERMARGRARGKTLD